MSYSCCSRAECRPAGLSQSKPRRALNDINQLAVAQQAAAVVRVIILIQILSSIHVRIMRTKVDGIFFCRIVGFNVDRLTLGNTIVNLA